MTPEAETVQASHDYEDAGKAGRTLDGLLHWSHLGPQPRCCQVMQLSGNLHALLRRHDRGLLLCHLQERLQVVLGQ